MGMIAMAIFFGLWLVGEGLETGMKAIARSLEKKP